MANWTIAIAFIFFSVEVIAREEIRSRFVTIATSKQIAQSFDKIRNGKPCHQIDDFSHSYGRGLVDLVVICKAFHAAGDRLEFKLITIPSHGRAILMIEQGQADLAAESVWLSDIAQRKLYISSPIIRDGEFEKGIYTRKDHPMHKIQPEDLDLSNYRAVTVKDWNNDMRRLNSLTQQVRKAIKQISVYRIIHAKRADFTLAEFTPTESMVVSYEGYELSPVWGVKSTVSGSRHFIISKTATEAKKIHEILNRGIENLRENNVLKESYQKAGFWSQKAANWRVVK